MLDQEEELVQLLEQFFKTFYKNTIWMHLDIAGVTWAKSDRPMTPKGGSGLGKTFNELVLKTSIIQGKTMEVQKHYQ